MDKKAYMKQWRLDNQERLRAYNREYAATHVGETASHKRERSKLYRRKLNPDCGWYTCKACDLRNKFKRGAKPTFCPKCSKESKKSRALATVRTYQLRHPDRMEMAYLIGSIQPVEKASCLRQSDRITRMVVRISRKTKKGIRLSTVERDLIIRFTTRSTGTL